MSATAPVGETDSPRGRLELRNRLQQGRVEIRARYFAAPDASRMLAAHARLIDDLLRDLWRQSGLPKGLALAAVGGYGRAELFPYSDVDILIVLPENAGSAWDPAIERLIGALWDTGLEVGHSVRTPTQCLEEAKRDVTVRTSLLEMRRIDGSTTLFRQVRDMLAGALDAEEFYAAKAREQRQRHLRYQETAFSLEPNLKESPGGLRDLQNLLWLAQAAGIGSRWEDLARTKIINAGEVRLLKQVQGFLRNLRIRLHYLANRREDRLLFDHQHALAVQYRISETKHRLASELLMQRYYRAAKTVGLLDTILQKNLWARLLPGPAPDPIPLDEQFQQRGEWLETRDPDLFTKRPGAIFDSLLALQRNPNLTGFSAETLRALWRASSLIDGQFRADPENRRRFLQILREPRRVNETLRSINHNGILGRYIPAFGRIVGQMQHDLFHAYTVDEHILKVLRNLRRFAVPAFAGEFPFCSELMGRFERVEVLYLAGLFHDIAKGRGGDHSKLGSVDARRFCQKLGLLEEDSALVSWLVQNHLTMSMTAQKEDLADPDVIARFAIKVGNERNLTALYLLTVADIRGTSPKVWNAWKGKLLEDLYRAAQRYMRGVRAPMQAEIEAKQRDTLHIIRQYAMLEGAQEAFWAKLDDQYFQRHEAQEIAWHTRMLRGKVDHATPIVRARLSPIGEGIQVMIYCPDREALFARICEFFQHLHYNIVEAKIYTTKDGHALDSFQVLSEGKESGHYRDLLSYVGHELSERLNIQKPLAAPSKSRISRRLKHFPIVPSVTLAPAEQGGYHSLSITAGDRSGLLYRIARCFLKHEVSLRSAKINTLGERAEDTFVVGGSSLDDPEQRAAFLMELEESLELQ